MAFAVLVCVVLFVATRRTSSVSVSTGEPVAEAPSVQTEQPLLPPPPQKGLLSAEAGPSAETCDKDREYWATGSWGRVSNISSRCWSYITTDSFAVECDADGMRSPTITFTLEMHQDLIIKRLVCVSCHEYMTPVPDKLISFSAVEQSKFIPNASIGKAKRVPPTPLRKYTVKISRKACVKGSGSYNHSCAVRLDALVTLAENAENLPEVCFVTIGDWGTATPDMLEVAAMLSNLARDKLLKFVVSTGDNFYPTGVQTLQDPHWQQTFELPFASQYLQNIRWYICAGNHDQWGVSSQLEYGEDHRRWYFPSLIYGDSIPLYRNPKCGSTDSIEMFVLNSAGKSTEKQVLEMKEFFSKRLSAEPQNGKPSPRKWRFVVNHEPIFSGGMHGQANRNKKIRESYLDPIIESRVHAYFNGDDHFLEVHRSLGTDFFVSGGGGGSKRYPTIKIPETVWMMPNSDEGICGVMLHCLRGGEMTTSLVNERGDIQYVHKTNFVSKWG